MLAAGVGLCLLTRRARRRERRVGFHCPLHGDFYPLSPITGSRSLGARVISIFTIVDGSCANTVGTTAE
ncbi:hypothetical protein L9F63_016950, partial [Diploptera punctata]